MWISLPRLTFAKQTLTALVGLLAIGILAVALNPAARGQAAKDPKKDPPPKPEIADVMVPGVGGLEQVSYINEEIERLWNANEIKPAPRADDYTFIRRATLDIIGRIPKVDEITAFMREPENTRRSRLIERLLASDEYARNFATMWTNLLLTRSAAPLRRAQMRLYLFDEFAEKEMDWSETVTELLTATGRTNENGAVNFILSHLGQEIKGNGLEYGKYDMVPITSRTTKLFLGLQTQCTQCHDHPFHDKWRQDHFWGINAFFRQVEAPQGRPLIANDDDQNQYVLQDNPNLNNTVMVPYEDRKALVLYTTAKFLDETRMPKNSSKTRRQLLAEFITQSPYFGKAFVNRLWGHFFGISFTRHGVADFGEHNPPSHPKLLERLAEDWTEKYQHNPRHLIRWICNSKAYGLSSVANKTTSTGDSKRFFGRMLLKPMSPEQLFESLTLATQPQLVLSAQEKNERKEEWLDRLTDNFGNDAGEEGSFNGTVVQALMLMNGKDINAAISSKDGAVEVALKLYGREFRRKFVMTAKQHTDVTTYLFLAALSRPPRQAELKRIFSAETLLLPTQKNDLQSRAFWKDFYEDLMWAMLNSNEFFLNH